MTVCQSMQAHDRSRQITEGQDADSRGKLCVGEQKDVHRKSLYFRVNFAVILSIRD